MSETRAPYGEFEINRSKTYQIELTCAELEFIKNMLRGLTPFMESLNGFRESRYLNGLYFEILLERIYPDTLAEKIFKQYVDEDGKLR